MPPRDLESASGTVTWLAGQVKDLDRKALQRLPSSRSDSARYPLRSASLEAQHIITAGMDTMCCD